VRRLLGDGLFKSALIFIVLGLALGGCGAGAPWSQSSALPPTATGGSGGPNRADGYYPGENAHGLPGGLFPCAPASGKLTQCTIVININIKPNPNGHLLASLVPGLHPSDLTAAYNLPEGGSGTVAIVDAFDDPLVEVEMDLYRAVFGLPSCTSRNGCFQKLNQSGKAGSYPRLNPNWAQEIALDVEMVSAVCPACKILLFEANSASVDDLGATVDTAARFHPTAISNSYYAPEWAGEQAEDVHYNHPGIAITASSGDHHAPSYPGASPYVTSVGGTSLSMTSNPRETAWLYSGGGCSAYVSKPVWQSGTSCGSRRAVDVAAVADPNTGVGILSIFAGGWVVAGGTSVGAPIVAASYALAGRGDAPSYSYARPTFFRSIPSDVQTGLGSPIGVGGF